LDREASLLVADRGARDGNRREFGQRVRDLEAEARRLADAIAAVGISPALTRRFRDVEAEVASLKRAQATAPVAILASTVRESVRALLRDLGGALNAELPVAREALRAALGDVRLQPEAGGVYAVFEDTADRLLLRAVGDGMGLVARACNQVSRSISRDNDALPSGSVNPVTEPLIISSGLAQIAAEVAGAGPVVVFLHAGVADRRMWQPQFAALTGVPPRCRAAAYDRRGFGETLHAEERYSQVGDLFRVLDAVAPGERAILVGCSQGGRIAIDAALADPARVRALVLVAPAISGAPEITPVPPALQAWLDKLELAETAADIDHINALEAHAWLDGPLASEGRVGGAVRELFLAMNDIALRAERRGTEVEPEAAYGHVREIAVPTLLVWGDLDFPHIAQRCRYLAVQMPRVTTLPMQNTAHLPSLEHPAQFDRALLAFLNSVTGLEDA